MTRPPIVSDQEWRSARDALLDKEKRLTRAQDALAAAACRWALSTTTWGRATASP
ncbi:DUF899 family protein [Nonomuraea wenchangensis]